MSPNFQKFENMIFPPHPQTGTLTVDVTSTGPLYYQWCLNNIPISGATGSSYSSTGLAYTVTISNGPGQMSVNVGSTKLDIT